MEKSQKQLTAILPTRPSRKVEQPKRAPEKKFAIGCWVNGGMIPFSGGLIISDTMLSITLQQPYGSDNTPMIRAMQKGMYTPLCAPEKYESADYLFEDIEGVQLLASGIADQK